MIYKIRGVPKTHFLGFLDIAPLWKGPANKVGCVSKNSGNSLSDSHQNFSIWPIRSWENWVQSWQPQLKILKKWRTFFYWTELFVHPLVLKFVMDNIIILLVSNIIMQASDDICLKTNVKTLGCPKNIRSIQEEIPLFYSRYFR